MRDMPPGRLTIEGFKADQAAKRAKMYAEVTAEVIRTMESNVGRMSRWERFCLNLAIA